MSLIKARLLDAALTPYQNFSSDRDQPENLTPSEFKALTHLAKNHIIQKEDKGNTVAILDNFLALSLNLSLNSYSLKGNKRKYYEYSFF